MSRDGPRIAGRGDCLHPNRLFGMHGWEILARMSLPALARVEQSKSKNIALGTALKDPVQLYYRRP